VVVVGLIVLFAIWGVTEWTASLSLQALSKLRHLPSRATTVQVLCDQGLPVFGVDLLGRTS
jgi:hypothetical protein